MSQRRKAANGTAYAEFNPKDALIDAAPTPPEIKQAVMPSSMIANHMEKMPVRGAMEQVCIRMPPELKADLIALQRKLGDDYKIRDIVCAGIKEMIKQYGG